MAVQERVEIVIKEKGAKATSTAIKGVGRSSRTAAKAVAALGAALAVIGGVRGLIGVAKGAVAASAAFESYGIQLAALLGSQDEANKALDNFVTLSSKTPFAVSQIVEGATALGAAALGNRERLEELTQTTANLAAVTGLSFQDAAGNLARALNAGIGAADLFRDKGITPLIEKLGGVDDAAKLTSEELGALFDTVFGAGGTFGDAAENLSATLGGSLSNIGDAAANLQVSLGDAFAPAVINTARKVIIPFLVNLREEVIGNEEAMGEFAAGAVRQALDGLLSMVRGGIELVRIFSRIDDGLNLLASGIVITFLEMQLAIEEANLAFNEFLGAPDDEVRAMQQSISDLNGEIGDWTSTLVDSLTEQQEFEKGLDAVRDRVEDLQLAFRNTDLSIDERVDVADIDAIRNAGSEGTAEGPTAEAVKSQEAAQKRILALTNQLRISEASRLEPLDGQLVRLEQQRDALQALAEASGDVTQAAEGLAILNTQIAATEAEKEAALLRQAQLHEEIAVLIAQAAAISPELAAEIERAAAAAVAAGGGLNEVNDELAQIGESAKSGIEDAKEEADGFGALFGDSVEGNLNSAISGAIRGEGFDAVGLLANVAGDLMESALSDALESLTGGFQDLFSGLGGGGALGGLVGGALTAGTAILAGALADTSTTISNNLVRSAASQSSAAATRGVIAGPTSVPIFQVGAQLEAAFGPTNQILADIASSLDILVSSGTGVGGGGSAAFDFDSTTPSLT